MIFRRLLAVLALGLLIGGCGEERGFLNDYEVAARPLQGITTDIRVPLGRAVAGETDAATANQFRRAAARVEQVNREVDELDAPDDAKAAFEDLKAAQRTVARHLREVAAAMKRGDTKATAVAVKKLRRDGKAISKAQTAVLLDLYRK